MSALWADFDIVYLWLALLGGAFFGMYVVTRTPRVNVPRRIFEVVTAFYIAFSLPSFYFRILQDGDDAWPIIWQFSLRWWVCLLFAVATSAIMCRYRRRED